MVLHGFDPRVTQEDIIKEFSRLIPRNSFQLYPIMHYDDSKVNKTLPIFRCEFTDQESLHEIENYQQVITILNRPLKMIDYFYQKAEGSRVGKNLEISNVPVEIRRKELFQYVKKISQAPKIFIDEDYSAKNPEGYKTWLIRFNEKDIVYPTFLKMRAAPLFEGMHVENITKGFNGPKFERKKKMNVDSKERRTRMKKKKKSTVY